MKVDKEIRDSPFAIRLGMEWAAGVLAALSVAPAISIIDKAIVSNASGKEKLVPCIKNGLKKLLKNPIRFVRQPSFLMIWAVYGGTYVVANSIELFCEQTKTAATIPGFIGSSVANASLSILKDRAFARMFGVGDPKPVPLISNALFATRDSMTILASFTLPKTVAKIIHKHTFLSKPTCHNIAQISAPCLMQFLSTPLHLYALDRYNRQEKNLTFWNRFSRVRQEYLKSTLARIGRILPAFGIGGIVNYHLRKSGKEFLASHSK